MRAARSGAVALLAVALVGGLGACHTGGVQNTGTVPSTSATPSPTPTPTPTSAPRSAPASLLAVACADLAVPPLEAAVPGAAPFDIEVRTVQFGGPSFMAIAALGGLTCGWRTGPDIDAPGYRSAEILALPQAAAPFANDTFAGNGDPPSCNPYGGCFDRALAGSTWVNIVLNGVADPTAAVAFMTEVTALVAAAEIPGTPTVPVSDIPRDCDALVTYDQLQSALPLTPAQEMNGIPVLGDIDGWAESVTGAFGCFFRGQGEAVGAGHVDTLPGGRWALEALLPRLTFPGTPVEVDVAGLAATDEAWLRCAPDGSQCALDLAIGEDWIAVELSSADLNALVFDRREVALALGAAIVENLARAAR